MLQLEFEPRIGSRRATPIERAWTEEIEEMTGRITLVTDLLLPICYRLPSDVIRESSGFRCLALSLKSRGVF